MVGFATRLPSAVWDHKRIGFSEIGNRTIRSTQNRKPYLCRKLCDVFLGKCISWNSSHQLVGVGCRIYGHCLCYSRCSSKHLVLVVCHYFIQFIRISMLCRTTLHRIGTPSFLCGYGSCRLDFLAKRFQKGGTA